MIGIEFQQWIIVEEKFDNFWFEQWRYKSSYQLPGFSLIYLPYIFLGQEPKFKHWEWQGNWDWVRGQENVCNCCVFRNQLRLPRHPPQWLARGQQDHTPRCGHVQVRSSRVHVSRWHVSLLQVRGGDDLLWAELSDHLPGGRAVESPRAPMLRSVSSSYQISECQSGDNVICIRSSLHRPLHLPRLHRGPGQRLHHWWVEKREAGI